MSARQQGMCSPLDILRDEPESLNPALVMAWNVKLRELTEGLDTDWLIEHDEEIQAAIEEAAEETLVSLRAIESLKRIKGVATSVTPVGF